jgi:hypothetical protein
MPRKRTFLLVVTVALISILVEPVSASARSVRQLSTPQQSSQQSQPGILSAQPETTDETLLQVYYPSAILSSIDDGGNAVDFILDPPDYLALVPGERVTAGVEPGTFPVGESFSTSTTWGPAVQSWLRGSAPPAPPGPIPVPLPPIVIPEVLNTASTPADTIIAASSEPSADNSAPFIEQFYRRRVQFQARQSQTCAMAARTGFTACGTTAVNGFCVVSCAAGYYGASTKYQCILTGSVAAFRNVTTVATCLPTTLCTAHTCAGLLFAVHLLHAHIICFSVTEDYATSFLFYVRKRRA